MQKEKSDEKSKVCNYEKMAGLQQKASVLPVGQRCIE